MNPKIIGVLVVAILGGGAIAGSIFYLNSNEKKPSNGDQNGPNSPNTPPNPPVDNDNKPGSNVGGNTGSNNTANPPNPISPTTTPITISLPGTPEQQTAKTIRIAAISDTHVSPAMKPEALSWLQMIANDSASQHLDFGVIAGDSTDAVHGQFLADMAYFQSNFGSTAKVPFITTYGDHGSEFSKHYSEDGPPSALFGGTFTKGSLNTNGQGWFMEKGTPYYWSMTYKGVHFVFLASRFDSNQMMKWLEQDLADNKNTTTILVNHYPAQPSVGGLDDFERDKLYDIAERNPQIVGLIAGHTHKGEEPKLLAGNMYQFWTWKGGEYLDSYIKNKVYLIYEISEDKIDIYKRFMNDGIESQIYSFKLPEKVTLQPQQGIKFSMPYLMRENQTVSLPFIQTGEGLKLRIWNTNIEQIANPSTVHYVVNSTNAVNSGSIARSVGEVNFLSQKFESTDAVAGYGERWGYYDIFTGKDLTSTDRAVRYMILASIRTSSDFKSLTGLELIDQNTGKVLYATSLSNKEADLFWNFKWSIHDGRAQGLLGNAPIGDSPINDFKNVTLRFWFGASESSKSVENLDLGLFVQKQAYMIAPAEGDGNYTSQNVRLEFTNATGAIIDSVDATGQQYDPYYEVPLEGKLDAANMRVTNIDGSRIALIEIVGSSDYPVLAYANPRQVISFDGPSITFGNPLYSHSATINDTILFFFADGDGRTIHLPSKG